MWHWKTWSRRRVAGVVLATVVATIAIVLLVVNFNLGDKKVRREIAHLYSIEDPQFRRSLGILLGPAVVDGNQATALINGDQIFPAMLSAIRGARETITFESYIYWSEKIGKEFADALAERARAGVKVHVLIDWVGSSKIDEALVETMTQAGVEVRKFHPLHWYNLGRLNNRTHRKLLVIDGRIGFTGGVGIASQWTGNAQDPDHWRDSHFRVEGPVVGQMQAVFMDNWVGTTGRVLHGAAYFPPLKPVGSQAGQMFSSSPNGGSESMQLMYLMAITAAKKSILIENSYFVPDELTIKSLIDAVKRGVKVQFITPGEHMDAETVRSASRGLWGDLLKAGVEMHEYQPTMFHCKVMIVDEQLVSVGSTNLDDRSLRLNDEANLNIYDVGFARQQVAVFNADLKKAHRITYEEWAARPWKEKAFEQVAAWLGPLL